MTHVGTPDDTASNPVRLARRALPAATRPLLSPNLTTTTANLGPSLGLGGADASVRLLSNQSLVHHADVRLDSPDAVVEVDRPRCLSVYCVQISFHVSIPVSQSGPHGLPGGLLPLDCLANR